MSNSHVIFINKEHIIDTIGSIDDLIEIKEKIIFQIKNYLLMLFKKVEESKSKLKFKDIFTTYNGGSFKSSEYIDDNTNKLITIKNIDDEGFNTKNSAGLNITESDKKFKLDIGDILMTMKGNIGRIGIVDCENCYLNQRVLKIKSTSDVFTFCFLLANKEKIIQLGKGTAQQNLGLTELNEMPVNYTCEQINDFNKYSCLYKKIYSLKSEIYKLQEMKQQYLKKFFG